nr:DMT family transporter [Actinomycetota bacterium]
LLLTALPLLAGAGAAWQQAFNGRVSVVGGPFAAAWLNFFVGTTLLTAFAAFTLVAGGEVTAPPATPTAWWLYVGGALGVVFISAAAVLVRLLGVLVFGLAAIAGQVITALLLDLRFTDLAVGPLTVAGAALTLAGVAIAASSARRTRSASPGGSDEDRVGSRRSRAPSGPV